MRKSEHIRICLEEDVSFKKTNGFEKYELIHEALPEVNLSEIDLSCTVLGKNFAAPVFIEAMTGGVAEARRINENLSGAAEQCGIGMGLGSQRVMMLNAALTDTYRIRHTAPTIFLAGNIGASQLKEFGADQLKRAMETVEADALAIHLNAAQELCQPEGDTGWANIWAAIERVCRQVEFPVIVKETGCGLSAATAKKLENAGVACIDTGGAGGTSWAKVEQYRGSKKAGLFLEWGIPTADSLSDCIKAVNIPVIASGGIRNGMEMVKALAMGAAMVGMAMPFLRPATISMSAVAERIEAVKKEIKATMFLIGAKRIADIDMAKIRCIMPCP
ncbi:MAG: type 2 isopentenyl-diphosphate Delta-isomerase [Desulfobacterales bacterium]|jgi:isopentenyl-diphosphate delta-isomerase|nr:type 2 isopentenyl-diphosphate Delta-isomerase [Desulfobacterales bacterium]